MVEAFAHWYTLVGDRPAGAQFGEDGPDLDSASVMLLREVAPGAALAGFAGTGEQD
ncbi:hypothetical protein AB0M46_08525 [Dactylosporangium sp. NPDC051485]|uniref:hypothetical protein n=1 Tax=Dactylosporangium sp. NPDC051485 TaxID=3154846 RepID=UPI00344609B5